MTENHRNNLHEYLTAENDTLRRKLASAEHAISQQKSVEQNLPVPTAIPDPPGLLSQLKKPIRRRRKIRPPRAPRVHNFETLYAARIQASLNPIAREISEKVLPHYDKWVLSQEVRLPGINVADSIRTDDEFEIVTAIFNQIRVGIFERAIQLARNSVQQAAVGVNEANKQANKDFFERVLRVDPFQSEPWLLPMSRNWVSENVSLIRSVKSEFLDDVEQMIFRMVRNGDSIGDVREALQHRFNVSKSRAKLIARDQVSKYNGQLTQARQLQVGVKEYTWMTSDDQRVRGDPSGRYPKSTPSHFIMQDVKCRWDDPTVYWNGKKWKRRTGKMPQEHPGQPIQCRCWASPVLDEILA